MNLLGLRYFIAVNEYESFTKASEHLYVSQPTLSRQIADLEEELGVLLFERKNRTISLTKAGETCLREAREIIAKCDGLREMVQAEEKGIRSSLRVGYLGNIEHGLMEIPMQNLSRKYPELDISISKTSLWELNQFLLEDQCDVVYSVKVGVDSIGQLDYVKVAKNRLKLIVPEGHPLSSREEVSVDELSDEHFVLFERNTTPLTVDATISMCVANGFSPSVVYYVRDAQSMVYAVGMGKGVAFLSERVEISEDCGVKSLSIRDCPLDFDIVLAYKKTNRNPYIPKFVNEVKKLDSF